MREPAALGHRDVDHAVGEHALHDPQPGAEVGDAEQRLLDAQLRQQGAHPCPAAVGGCGPPPIPHGVASSRIQARSPGPRTGAPARPLRRPAMLGGMDLARMDVAAARSPRRRPGWCWAASWRSSCSRWSALVAVLVLGRPARRAPDPLPAEPPAAADDLPGFLEHPPGSPGAPSAAAAGWPVLTGAPAPAPRRVPAPVGPEPGRRPAVVALAAMAVTTLLLVGVAAALAAAAQSAGTGAESTPTAADPTPAPAPAAPSPGEPGAGALATASIPPGLDGVEARLTFGGIVLERRAVGVTATYPQVTVTSDGEEAVAHVVLPTFNCLTDRAPADPVAAGCVASLTEYADLATPALTVTRDGDGVRIAGRFPTYLRPNGTPPDWTGHVYELPSASRRAPAIPTSAACPPPASWNWGRTARGRPARTTSCASGADTGPIGRLPTRPAARPVPCDYVAVETGQTSAPAQEIHVVRLAGVPLVLHAGHAASPTGCCPGHGATGWWPWPACSSTPGVRGRTRSCCCRHRGQLRRRPGDRRRSATPPGPRSAASCCWRRGRLGPRHPRRSGSTPGSPPRRSTRCRARSASAAARSIELALPIGISFFTFHHISYVVDVYRHSRRAQKSPVQFVTYIAMFPQLVAGPIVRYHEIADQLADTDRNRLDDFAAGFPRFAWGLTKKVVIADTIAPVADAAFATSGGDMTTATAWLGALAYTLQIYFDFSGYSDMAIGLGLMFGFRLPENFDRPYSAVSITDFWRRWHMSLSRWFRDYVYIPLGGNRHGAGTDLPQPVHRLRRHRLLARRRLDLPGLGALPRGPAADRARDRLGRGRRRGLAIGAAPGASPSCSWSSAGCSSGPRASARRSRCSGTWSCPPVSACRTPWPRADQHRGRWSSSWPCSSCCCPGRSSSAGWSRPVAAARPW